MATIVLILAYLVGVNLLGIRWALADRDWLMANPDMWSPADRATPAPAPDHVQSELSRNGRAQL